MVTRIQNQVMKKVYLIWFTRKVLPYALADLLVFTVFLYLIGQFVFVRMVLENLTRILFASPGGLAVYVFGAVLGTKFVVQVSLAGALTAFILASKNIFAVFVQLGVLKEETNLRRQAF